MSVQKEKKKKKKKKKKEKEFFHFDVCPKKNLPFWCLSPFSVKSNSQKK